MSRSPYLLLFALILYGCDTSIPSPVSEQAYVPVYASQSTTPEEVAFSAPQPIIQAGKIYAYGHYILQNELNEGIHIIDHSVYNQPQKIAFIKIPYNSELAVRGNFLYANSGSDLLVIDLQNMQQPVVTERIENAFPLANQKYPPFQGSFVCPDPEKGIVIAWELKNVKNANCRR